MNLSLEERERIAYANGEYAESDLLALAADAEADTANIDAAKVHIEEAMSSLTAEDFLVDIIEKVTAMSKQRVTKKDMEHLAAFLEDFQMDIFNQADYARNELREALKALK